VSFMLVKLPNHQTGEFSRTKPLSSSSNTNAPPLEATMPCGQCYVTDEPVTPCLKGCQLLSDV
jgi:hypothetical protein